MQDAVAIERIRSKYLSLSAVMDERIRRQWAATEAIAIGWGGVSLVSKATGLARNTVSAGIRELSYRAEHPDEGVTSRLRAPGGGRKRATDVDPDLMRALESLVEPATRSGISLEMDLQEHTEAGRRIDPSESPGDGPHGCRTPETGRLQFAGQSQDAGGNKPL